MKMLSIRFVSIRFNRELDSNERNQIVLHALQQSAHIVVIDPGIPTQGNSKLSRLRMNMVSIEPELTILHRTQGNLT
jgi:hypothetical protein